MAEQTKTKVTCPHCKKSFWHKVGGALKKVGRGAGKVGKVAGKVALAAAETAAEVELGAGLPK